MCFKLALFVIVKGKKEKFAVLKKSLLNPKNNFALEIVSVIAVTVLERLAVCFPSSSSTCLHMVTIHPG